MNEIKQWAMAVAISALVGAIVLIVAPKGGTEKIVRTAVSLFLLCVILNPFLSGFDFEKLLPKVQSENSNSEMLNVRENTANQMENKIYEKVNKILKINGIKNAEIYIDIMIDKNNNMSINSVNISADSQYRSFFNTAEKQIKESLGIETEIEVEK